MIIGENYIYLSARLASRNRKFAAIVPLSEVIYFSFALVIMRSAMPRINKSVRA
jgi:hypothetical protein